LGVPLILQLVGQRVLHLRSTIRNTPSSPLETRRSALNESGVDISLGHNTYEAGDSLQLGLGIASGKINDRVEIHTHTPTFSYSRYSLSDADMMNWLNGR